MDERMCNKCDHPHPLSDNCWIPDADCYVVSHDKFMSGWGYAKDKTNVCVVPCDSHAEAEKVYDYILHHRTDQQRLRINIRKPQPRKGLLISNLSSWKKLI